MTIYDIIHSVWRNYSRHDSTVSQCDCGRKARRGNEPCLLCLSDKITATGKVDQYAVTGWFDAIRRVREIEQLLIDELGNDTTNL